MAGSPQLLTDPLLQCPSERSVRVVWFTAFRGSAHAVWSGPGLAARTEATTTQLSRTREDADSWQPGGVATLERAPQERPIWRHEAEVRDLTPGERVPYCVASRDEAGSVARSATFELAPKPPAGQRLQILLTSDHQLKPMTAANLQQVGAVADRVDGIFFAGDLTDVPDRASHWFDDARGGAFFPCLQGNARVALERGGRTTTYRGAPLLQSAPLFTAIGNHEVMGRFSREQPLEDQMDAAIPRSAAERLDGPAPASAREREAWFRDRAFNAQTYREILTLPQRPSGDSSYYAVTLGDIRLVVLYATCVWRTPSLDPDACSKYRERDADLPHPHNWGYGQHIFEPIHRGSAQYRWLAAELAGEAFQQAPYRIVMLHHPPHSLGANVVPAYTDPVQSIERDSAGRISAVRYEYPQERDYLARDVVPLLEAAGTQLVFYGHSHLWNRFVSASGTHYLESSNVGNSYGAYWRAQRRPVPTHYRETYTERGDPYGLEPVVPNIAPLHGDDGQPLPYIASNTLTAFSLLDTGRGTVSSYRFDTRTPEAAAIKFDEFALQSSA